jgi:serine protease AprX
MNGTDHQHEHTPNRFAVIPTHTRLGLDDRYSGKGVRIAFLDSGFYPHPDLVEPRDRIIAYHDVAGERTILEVGQPAEPWQWHGTQTSVACAGNGHLGGGVYRGLAHEAELALVKASVKGRITEESIAEGIRWVIANRELYDIRVLNISLGGDEDVPCSQSIIDQAAEEAVSQGIVVVVAAGNSGAEGRHSIPPANAPSVITVGGYHDNNLLGGGAFDLYESNYGFTADGTVKPEVVAPARWVAAPILPGTPSYEQASALSRLAAAPDYQLPGLARELWEVVGLSETVLNADAAGIRAEVEASLQDGKIIAAHYQHVDGTSFAAPIVTSIVAQMIEANPDLTPAAIKSILISTARRIADAPVLRQGYGVVDPVRALELARTEAHALAGPGSEQGPIKNGRLVFRYHNDTARDVALAGDFNNWNPAAAPFLRDNDGLWTAAIALPPPGNYQYKLVLNGDQWIEDPGNDAKTPDNYGGLNSVLVVEMAGSVEVA